MILAVLQARMSSTRLPGKVLRPLLGTPMIGRQIERLRACETLDRLVVATSLDASDEPLTTYCETLGVRVFRGSLNDVLGRLVGAVAAYGPADHVVRLTADCPLTDPLVIDQAVRLHLARGADYTSNAIQRTFPDGLDVEVMRASVLAAAQAEATTNHDREHVTPFINTQPYRFSQAHLVQTPDRGTLRWTVDTAQDFAFAEAVYAALDGDGRIWGQSDVLALPFGQREAA